MNLREKIARTLSPLLEVALRSRTIVKFFLTLGIFLSAYCLAYVIRFEFDVPPNMTAVMRRTIPVLVTAKVLGFFACGQFRGWWRYVSIKDVLPIAAGTALGSLLFAAGVWGLWGPTHVPRSIYLLDWMNTLALVLGARYLIRMGREGLGRRGREADRRVLIVGAGAAGQMIAREMAGERFPRDGAGRVHRRRPGEDRHADPRGESAGGTREDRRHLRETRRQRDHHRDPVRPAVGGPSHRGALPESVRRVPDPARHRRPDRRKGVRPRAPEGGPRGPAGAGPGGAGCRPAPSAHHGANGDGDRGGGVDRLRAVPPDRAAVAGAADPVRDRGEPAVLLRDGDAGAVPDRGPGPRDRRRARPGKGRGGRPRPSSARSSSTRRRTSTCR